MLKVLETWNETMLELHANNYDCLIQLQLDVLNLLPHLKLRRDRKFGSSNFNKIDVNHDLISLWQTESSFNIKLTYK